MPGSVRIVLVDCTHHIILRGQSTGTAEFIKDIERKVGNGSGFTARGAGKGSE